MKHFSRAKPENNRGRAQALRLFNFRNSPEEFVRSATKCFTALGMEGDAEEIGNLGAKHNGRISAL